MYQLMKRAVAAGICVLSTGAAGQCGGEWLPGQTAHAGVPYARTLLPWDPDGVGPRSPWLICANRSSTIGRVATGGVAAWDGAGWRSLQGGTNGIASAIAIWDMDGDGPGIAGFVLGGQFTTAGGVPAQSVAYWNGESWQAMGSGLDFDVSELHVWDADGQGPKEPVLIAGGSDGNDANTFHSIAMWDGVSWKKMGSGFGDKWVFAICSWDHDNDPSTPTQLFAGGSFDASGATPLKNIAMWDGSNWVAIPNTPNISAAIHDLEVVDLDGEGPRPPQLVLGGAFSFGTPSGPALRVAVWTGERWEGLGSTDGLYFNEFETIDHDGDGPLPSTLYAVGGSSMSGYLWKWNPEIWNWQMMDNFGGALYAASAWDPDGPGPADESLAFGGDLTGIYIPGFGLFDGTDFSRLGEGVNARMERATSFRGDLIAYTSDSSSNSTYEPFKYLGRWDGVSWTSLGDGLSGNVATLRTHRFGNQPDADRLVAGGSISAIGGIPVKRLAAWDGTAWSDLGANFDSSVIATTTWQPGGQFGDEIQLIAGGSFTRQGSLPMRYISRLSQNQWLPIGDGFNGDVRHLTTWDSDGAQGSLTPNIIAVGAFTAAGTVPALGAARWNGTQWLAMDTGLTGSMTGLIVWHADGNAAPPGELLAYGSNLKSGTRSLGCIARWSGSQWVAFDSNVTGDVMKMEIWYPNGMAQPPRLAALGGLSVAGAACKIAVLEGSTWSGMNPVLSSGASLGTLAVLDVPADSPHQQLVFTGNFATVNGIASGGWARYAPNAAPYFATHPQQVPGYARTLKISAQLPMGYTSRPGGVSYQWYRDGVAIENGLGGAAPGGGTVVRGIGVSTSFEPIVLEIQNPRPQDSGTYHVSVFNECGGATSNPVDATAPCPADFDGTGFVDTDDFTAYVTAFEAGEQSADFDGTGFVDTDDFTSFVLAFEAGC
ncbi:MAG TPA: GC-type dockerin domain-anchored protein [Phycisphaerales bacterium]|nr:GC-type dockerin domain-anchored protein [Phycisphaerales bacterium]